MLKINNLYSKSFIRYGRKNTVNAKYNRSVDMANLSAIGTGFQILRIPTWQIHDVGITAGLTTLFIKGIKDILKNKALLKPIKDRAISIKKSSVHDV